MRIVIGLIFAALALAPAAEQFEVYPGAVLDAPATKAASYGRTQSQVYVTNDSYDRVYAFYKSRYKENPWPLPSATLPSGKKVQSAIFILDGAKNLATSKLWVKVQRPFIFTVSKETGEFEDIRDVSVIQSVVRLR